MIVNHQVRVIRFFSKSLVGSQLNWSAREKECYDIYYGVKLFEDLFDNRYFILKTDHMNLININVTFTGKELRWKICLKDKDFDLYPNVHPNYTYGSWPSLDTTISTEAAQDGWLDYCLYTQSFSGLDTVLFRTWYVSQ